MLIVDGDWGGWSNYGKCTKTCGSGKQTRTRSCDNPPRDHGGNDCTGSNDEERSCNTNACPGTKALDINSVLLI